MTDAERTDVVVAGAGMAGLVSAVRALESGVEVVVLEKGNRAGGSMYVAGGAIWTFESLEEIRELSPGGNADLQRLVYERLDGGFDWLADQGVELGELTIDIPGEGMEANPAQMTEALVDRIDELGGDLRLQTPMKRLREDDTGGVEGVVAEPADGKAYAIDADAVVLATGGFQGNEELVERHITENTDDLWLRSNPWSTGDGLLAAREVGAKTTKGMSWFYGHNLAAPPAEFTPFEFREASQYYGPLALAVDRDGERFVDESISENEETLVQATVKRAGGRAYYLLDADLYGSTFHAGSVGTMVERAEEFGGRTLEADSLDALGERIAEWGVDGGRLVETVEAFNDAVREGRADELDPPRGRFRRTFDEPPFYAVEVQPGITFTMGGLDVDSRGRVLSRSGTSSMLEYYPEDPREVQFRPIDGLYAAGTDVGNVHNRRYLGGLAVALVTGLVAAESAAEASG